MTTSMSSFKEETYLYMFAHSDDSGGRLTVTNRKMATRALILYEIGLKGCNHLLSKKKSVISRIYFEILSIIYLFKQLLALLPKFLGGLRFLPTDKGACQDMSQSYSKCIEVMVAGANFSIAYIVLKIYSAMIWRFYQNQDLTENDYKRPVQYLGMPDAHPLMALLCGSDSDIIRLYHTGKEHLHRSMAFSKEMIESNEEPGPVKPYKFEIRVKSIKKDFEEMINDYGNILDSWSVRNINYHNSGFNFLNFLNKLRDAGFVGSLVNESTTRRFSRAFFMKNNDVILTKFGNMKIREVTDALRLFQSYSSKSSAVKHIFNDVLSNADIEAIDLSIDRSSDKINVLMGVLKETLQSPIKLYTYLDKLTMKGRRIEQHHRTLKPTVVQLVKSTPVFSSNFDPTSLVSFIKEPDMRWALPNVRGLFTAEIELKTLLDRRGLNIEQIDSDSLLKICRDFGPNSIKTIYLYSRIPSELRQVKSYSAFLTFLSVNSFENSEISGLTVKLTSSEITSEFTSNNINEDIYYLVNILSSLCVLYQKIDLDFFETITLNEIPEFKFEGGKISNLINHIWNSLGSDINITYYRPYLDYLSIILNDTSRHAGQLSVGSFYTFIKSQKLKSGWYGKGEIYINIESKFYSFELYNQSIVSVITNHTGKVLQHHSDYIFDVMQYNGLEIHKMVKVKKSEREGMASFFGFDYSGHLSCGPSRELVKGVSCLIKSNRGAFVDELNTFTISNLSNNILTVRCDIYEKPIIKKIYLLPLKKGEIVNTYLRILKREDFEDKLNNEGLGTFEEFIYTELLTEYGGENYISLNNLLDNFSASKLFQIFTECRKKEISMIPKNVNFSNFPANMGSLTKILIDYGEYTGKHIIKTNLEYNAAMMQVVSEYPEKMSVILSDKLVDCYDKMYTREELKEISDEYHNLSESDDPDLIRCSIIKLMTHWGYGSFVNSIQNFSLKRVARNYNFFNLLGLLPDRIGSFSQLFVYTTNCIIKEMLNWSEQYRGLEFDNPRLRNITGVTGICMNFIRYICVGLYGYKIFDKIPSIIIIQFYAALTNFMKEEEFCASLQFSFNKNYLLGSIPISYNYRNEFIILLNTLRHIWSSNNKIEFLPSKMLKNERLPPGIPNWKSISNQFNISIPPILSMYNGYINTQTVQEIMKRCNGVFNTRFGRYHLRSELKGFSNVEVPTVPAWKPARPIKQSVLESDLWEDFISEFDFEEIDIDTIDELIGEMGNIYVQKSTVIKGFGSDKSIFGNISIVIDTLSECQNSNIKKLRQIGQNIIWIRTVESSEIIDSLYNCKLRVVQFTRGEILFIYTSFQNELNNDELLNYMFGEVNHYMNDEESRHYNVSIIRDRDGVAKSSLDLGFFFEDKIMSGDAIFVNDGEIITTEDKAEPNIDDPVSTPKTESEDVRVKVVDKIMKLEKEGLSKETCNKLLNKYLGLINDYSLSLKIAMSSLLEESELMKMSKSLAEQTSLLTPVEYKKTFMAPTHFGAAYGLGNYGDKNIKDKNIKAEIEAFHEELSSRVGSGAIFISKKFRQLAIANLKFWNSSVKSTNYKKENKAFAVLVYTSLLNCCKVVEDDRDDLIWQDCINRMTLYISDEKEDSDDDEDLMSLIEDIKSHSRLIYRPKGT